MRSNHLISAVAIVGLTILSTSASALEQVVYFARAAQLENGPLPRGDHSGSPAGANSCPADNIGTLTDGSTIVGSTIGSTDDFVAGCGSYPGGQDEVFEFAVDVPGEWRFDTCTVPACWNTTLEIREETGGGCPGDFVACDGDRCNACDLESSVQTFLVPTAAYYLIVDGWSTSSYGEFTVTATLVVPGCSSDADCDDGTFCNGAETCNLATGRCFRDPGPNHGNPCSTYEGYAAPCDEELDVCSKPDDCFIWQANRDGMYYAPGICSDSPGDASWVLDDIQGSHHTTGVLDYYTTPIISRSTPDGASPLGTIFQVDQALFTVTAGTCNPLAEIAGSQCTQPSTIHPGGTPPDELPCSGTNPNLPNNAGDFNRCEVDFFIAMRTSELGSGWAIADGPPILGGPAAADEFGVSSIWIEDCPPTFHFAAPTFGCPGCTSDFRGAVVCAKPGGSCCLPGGGCAQMSQADCAAEGGDYGFTGTIHGTDGGCGGDPDGDHVDNRCGDNCENTANPGQEDCDGDGAGDACDAEADGNDGDGVCQGVDNCPFRNNPGQEDTDGDGVGDACDPCPNASPDDSDGDGVCDNIDICLPGDDNVDTDGDGVPDDCDECPGTDDGIAGALGDADGDGVLNCNDLCPGVDDVALGDCTGTIPTVSVWGLLILALLLSAGSKVVFRGRSLRYSSW
ncbi:MAG: thrombospondin type 3 repeat-containing protein [Planctomycetes bacterium]|nr:thrombospondin type 3 repeat-containing protein [Planctomycetota bacterium]